MCGIVGSINLKLGDEALELIHHRGPDSHGLLKQTVFDHEIFLGQTRLAIIDLSETGFQPMESQCGNYAITFNGEIYNHLELRKELPEVNFKGHSDTETILYYLIKFGIEGAKKFNGIFAFGFLDKVKNILYLARDFFGVKPLYYAQNKNTFIFSSEIRPLQNRIKTELDTDNIAILLKLRFIPAPGTLCQGIKKLRPGHFAAVSLEKNTLSISHSALSEKIPETVNNSLENAVSRYGDLLGKAVERQLLSDVEVGILLSGGIDSAVIASLAQQNTDYRMKAFTIGFSGEYLEDETEEARETADLLGLELYSEKIDFDDFLSIFRECIRIIEEPLATTSIIPMYFLAQLASRYVKVVLSGQGADESLGGYKRYQGEILSGYMPRFLIRWAGKIMSQIVKKERLLRAGDSLGEKDVIQRFVNIYSIFSDDEISCLLGRAPSSVNENINYFYDLLGCERKKHTVEQMLSLDLRMNLADDLLLYTDKITMNFALECRVPLLDVDLIDYIESLPIRYRVKLGKTKIIHKNFAADYLPNRIINRPKKGFMSPTRIWFSQHEKKIRELLTDRGSKFSKYVNTQEVHKIIDQHQQGYNREKQIFLLLGLYYWMEDVLDRSN